MITFPKIDLNKIPFKNLIIVALVAALFITIRGCQMKDLAINQEGIRVQFYQNKAMEYSQKKNELGMNIATQEQLILQKTKELESLLLENSKLKKLKSQVEIQTNTILKQVFVPFTDTIIDSTGVVEKRFDLETEWYDIKGNVNNNGIYFDTLAFRDKIRINTGYAKAKGINGFLGAKVPTVEVINENPYTSLSGMKNITLEEKKPWYKTRAFYFGLGFATAIGIGVATN